MKHPHHHKKLVSIVVLIVGILLLIYSINSMQTIARGKKAFTQIEVPTNEIEVMKQERTSVEYDTIAVLSLVAGIVLCVSGASTLFFYRAKKKRR